MPGFIEWLDIPAGRVPRISSVIGLNDQLGACKARWGIGRMSFMVPPGLYAIGHPTETDPVLVTANYKMSYDIVRSALVGRNVWLLVLETYGINVWCAAGKGTFGTGELVRRIASSGLPQVVSHRRLILPMLGAAGVSSHEVTRRSGFSISYATIRATDLPEYLDNGMLTSNGMREMSFTFYDRLVLIPVEMVLAVKSMGVIVGALLLLTTVMSDLSTGLKVSCAYIGAVVSGLLLGPLLLPWLPGRSFAVKGAEAGLVWSAAFYVLANGSVWNWPVTLAVFMTVPAVSAFHTLNFTGCSPYTSRSGVKKEMRIALPVMGGAIVLGLVLLLAGRFL